MTSCAALGSLGCSQSEFNSAQQRRFLYGKVGSLFYGMASADEKRLTSLTSHLLAVSGLLVLYSMVSGPCLKLNANARVSIHQQIRQTAAKCIENAQCGV